MAPPRPRPGAGPTAASSPAGVVSARDSTPSVGRPGLQGLELDHRHGARARRGRRAREPRLDPARSRACARRRRCAVEGQQRAGAHVHASSTARVIRNRHVDGRHARRAQEHDRDAAVSADLRRAPRCGLKTRARPRTAALAAGGGARSSGSSGAGRPAAPRPPESGMGRRRPQAGDAGTPRARLRRLAEQRWPALEHAHVLLRPDAAAARGPSSVSFGARTRCGVMEMSTSGLVDLPSRRGEELVRGSECSGAPARPRSVSASRPGDQAADQAGLAVPEPQHPGHVAGQERRDDERVALAADVPVVADLAELGRDLQDDRRRRR